MRFPHLDHIGLPVTFVRYVPGELHPSGRRFLPQLVFRFVSGGLVGVVDRHHYVDPDLVGSEGSARFVYLLSEIALQPPGMERKGIEADATHIATAPAAYGQVVAVPSWEFRREMLPYDTLFTEILLDVGDGIVGVRTSLTAADMRAMIGTEQLRPGDWLRVNHSRIDILGFAVAASVGAADRPG
jgi:hypothetical protein